MGGVGRQSRREALEEASLSGESEGLTWLGVGCCDLFLSSLAGAGRGGGAVGASRKEKHLPPRPPPHPPELEKQQAGEPCRTILPLPHQPPPRLRVEVLSCLRNLWVPAQDLVPQP